MGLLDSFSALGDDGVSSRTRDRDVKVGELGPILPLPVQSAETQRSASTSLKSAAEGLFGVGVGVGLRITGRPDDWRLLTSQFGYVTPENCMKVAGVQPDEGRFNFSRTDAFVDFATEKQLKIVGHCLVWAKDDRTPAWFYRDGENDASREIKTTPRGRGIR